MMMYRQGVRLALVKALVLVAVGVLSACSASLPKKPIGVKTYDFGLIQVAGEEEQAEQRPLLVLHPITAPQKLSGQAMLYRLAYQDTQHLMPYSQSKWADAPARLLLQLFETQLSTSYSVLSPVQKINMTAHKQPAVHVRMELLEFSQVFYKPVGQQQAKDGVNADKPSSEAVLQARVVVSKNIGNQAKLHDNRVLTVRLPAGNNAATGAKAMREAALRLSGQLQQMLAEKTH